MPDPNLEAREADSLLAQVKEDPATRDLKLPTSKEALLEFLNGSVLEIPVGLEKDMTFEQRKRFWMVGETGAFLEKRSSFTWDFSDLEIDKPGWEWGYGLHMGSKDILVRNLEVAVTPASNQVILEGWENVTVRDGTIQAKERLLLKTDENGRPNPSADIVYNLIRTNAYGVEYNIWVNLDSGGEVNYLSYSQRNDEGSIESHHFDITATSAERTDWQECVVPSKQAEFDNVISDVRFYLRLTERELEVLFKRGVDISQTASNIYRTYYQPAGLEEGTLKPLGLVGNRLVFNEA